ncbi:hypothetical protein ACFX5D_01365 [Flavobacterium sp. LB3P45]|uniref:Uncharacterized protein n=1 Tax=Flavobacterium fructosi TaxID=3230416 RepID=A0ABW6HHW4_9FLAO
MKKTFYIVIAILFVFFMAVNYLTSENESILSTANESTIPSDNKTKISSVSNPLSITERNEKLIGLCKSVSGTIDADVRGDILTVQFSTVAPEEAQKIAQGILSTIKQSHENDHIKTVMVCDIDYKLLGYAGAKK